MLFHRAVVAYLALIYYMWCLSLAKQLTGRYSRRAENFREKRIKQCTQRRVLPNGPLPGSLSTKRVPLSEQVQQATGLRWLESCHPSLSGSLLKTPKRDGGGFESAPWRRLSSQKASM